MNRFLKDNKYAAIGITAFLAIAASALTVFVIFNFGLVLSGIKRGACLYPYSFAQLY